MIEFLNSVYGVYLTCCVSCDAHLVIAVKLYTIVGNSCVVFHKHLTVKIIKLDMTGAIFIIVGVCYSYIFIIVKYAVYQLFQLNSLLELWLLASVKYHNILI